MSCARNVYKIEVWILNKIFIELSAKRKKEKRRNARSDATYRQTHRVLKWCTFMSFFILVLDNLRAVFHFTENVKNQWIKLFRIFRWFIEGDEDTFRVSYIIPSQRRRILIDTAYCGNTSLIIKLIDNDIDMRDKHPNRQCVFNTMVMINHSWNAMLEEIKM